MISPWQIYWVMQLDSISAGLTFITCFGLVIVGGSILWNTLSKNDAKEFPSLCNVEERKIQWESRDKWRNRTLLFILPLFFFNMLIPSSKTAAAMIVIPAIANNQRVQSEASELYDLAKIGLKKLVTEEPKKDER